MLNLVREVTTGL